MVSEADFQQAVINGKQALAGLSAVTTGTSAALTLDNSMLIRSATLIVRGSAGISAGAVQLQGTLDNSNWFNVGSPLTAVASTNVQQYSNLHAIGIRATISTAIVGGTVTTDLAADAMA